MSEQSRYTVTLLNQQLSLVSDQKQEIVASVCEVVDKLSCDIAINNPSASKASIAILTAIKLAEKLVLTEKAIQEATARIVSMNVK